MLYKNTAGQQISFLAWDQANGIPKTGDAANITANIYLDGVLLGATTTTNPTEIAGGMYFFPLTQAETNAENIILFITTTTASVQIRPVDKDTIDLSLVAADVSALALEANVQTHAAAALTAYDPPTRAELTTDKDSIITEVNANETKIDAIQTDLDNPSQYKADVSALATTAALSTHDGKLDTVDANVDSILEDTGTTLPATLVTITNYLNTEIAEILADTNELQIDLTDGGRLDLLIDAIKAKTDNLKDAWNDITVADILAGTVESTITIKKLFLILLARHIGIQSDAGAASGSAVFRDFADTLDRVTLSTDANGKRLTTTLDFTDL